MKQEIHIQEFKKDDFDSLLAMSKKLWPDFEPDELNNLLSGSVTSGKEMIWIAKVNRQVAGFVIFSIRTDYVEGAAKSPTGYLEGIYVEESFRKMGIAKEFVQIGEAWCKTKGCTQVGSDTWLTNEESRAFHQKIGFWEEDELVHFLKDIKS